MSIRKLYKTFITPQKVYANTAERQQGHTYVNSTIFTNPQAKPRETDARGVEDQTIIDKIKLNDELVDLYIDDPEYGLVPDKPVFAAGFIGARKYIDRLISTDGCFNRYERLGSREVEGVNGQVDCFKIFSSDGVETTIYISFYASTTSEKAPAGFLLRGL